MLSILVTVWAFYISIIEATVNALKSNVKQDRNSRLLSGRLLILLKIKVVKTLCGRKNQSFVLSSLYKVCMLRITGIFIA